MRVFHHVSFTKTLRLWRPQNAEESSVSTDEHTLVGMWDLHKDKTHKSYTGRELVKKSDGFTSREKDQSKTQILYRNKKTLSKACLELPWNHHSETELFLASSIAKNCCLCPGISVIYKALTQQSVGLSNSWQTHFFNASSLQCKEDVFHICSQSDRW